MRLTLKDGGKLSSMVEKMSKPKANVINPDDVLARYGADGLRLYEMFMGDFEAAKRVCDRVKLMALAESLGGVETLICHPASMTHASVPPDRRAAIGLTESMVRISAGIEDPADLVADLQQALA